MAYSFTNPVVDAKIWSPTDGEVNLSIFGEEPKIPYVQNVKITTGMAYGGEIEISMSPTRDEAIRLLDETNWFKLGNILAVRWGYNDGQPGHISDWIYGMMLLPDLQMGEEVSLSIKATTFGVQADRQGSSRTWSKPDSPAILLDVIKEVCKKYGFTFMISEGEGYLPPEALSEQDKALMNPRTDIVQAGLTDLQFLGKYIREAGAEMAIIGEKLIMFLDPAQSKPAAEFHMYGRIDPSKNIYPMLSFDPESLGPLFLPSVSYSTAMYGWNADPFAIAERQSVTGSASAGDSASDKNFLSGEQALETPGVDGPAHPDSGLKVSVMHDPLSDIGKDIPMVFPDVVPEDALKEQARTVLQGVMDGSAEDYGITVNISSIAIPTLLVNQTARLRGVSRFFSTDYIIRNIDVNIAGDGATMDLELGARGIAPDLCNWADYAKLSSQGETQPGDGGEDVPPDSGAGE